MAGEMSDSSDDEEIKEGEESKVGVKAGHAAFGTPAKGSTSGVVAAKPTTIDVAQASSSVEMQDHKI